MNKKELNPIEININTIEEIVAGGSYSFDVMEDKFNISNKYAEMLGYIGKCNINKQEYVDIFWSGDILVKDKYIAFHQHGNFETVYKLDGSKEDRIESFQFRVVSESGYIYYKNSYKISFENGKVKSIKGLIFDVTIEQKRENEYIENTKQLKKLTVDKKNVDNDKELYKSVLDCLPLGVFVKDPNDDYKSVLFNSQAIERMDFLTESSLGKSDYELFDKEKADEWRAYDVEIYENKTNVRYDEHVILEGVPRVTSINKYISTLENGKDYIIGIISDVTEEKEKEQELLDAKEKAEDASASQSRFVANMSHEIRTPLNAILGYAEIMREYNIDKKLDNYLISINTAGNSLLSLVNDILDYSKVKANKFTATYIPATLSGICEELKVLFYHKITQKNLDFELMYDTELPTFMLPTATIRQVLINIIGNASKFTNSGSIIIRALANEDENGDYDITISVTDTGIGIPKNKLDMIFGEFEQADQEHEKSGTGLGLALSVNFAKLIGGRVTVESKVGEGSVFTLHMEGVKLASNEIQAMHKTKENEKFKFFNQKAIVLDDIRDNREVLSAHCDYMNIEVRSYETGGEALIAMETYKPDIILTDLRMPIMSGEEFAKNVRALDEFKEIPIICITASINPEENYHLENFNEVLNKPISSHKLAIAMSKYLEFENINENMVDVIEFNLQTAFRNLEMSDEEYAVFKEEHYEVFKNLKRALNPKKIKEATRKLDEFAKEINNETLDEISSHLQEYCEALDISKMMETVTLIVNFLELR